MDLDRKRMLFTSRSGNNYLLNLYDVRRNKVVKRIALRLDVVYGSALSPDGKKAALIGVDRNRPDLYICNLADGSLEKITDDDWSEDSPAWSPDGTVILFSANRGISRFSFRRIIYSYNLTSKKTEPYIVTEHNAGSPAYAPDGKKLLFISGEHGSDNIYIKDLETMKTYQITDFAGGAVTASWSFDGKSICYSVFNSGGHDVFITKPDLEDSAYYKKSFYQDIDKLDNTQKETYTAGLNLNREDALYRWVYDPQNAENASYRPQLRPDFFLTFFSAGGGYGFGGRFIIGLSDMLNNHNCYIDTLFSYYRPLNFLSTDSYLQILNLSRRLNFSATLYYFQNNRILAIRNYEKELTPDNVMSFTDRNIGISHNLLYPLNKYTRTEASFLPMILTRTHNEVDDLSLKNKYPEWNTYALIGGLSLTHDSVFWGWIRPMDNSRWEMQLRAAPPAEGALSFFQVSGDFRHYWMLNRYVSFAARFMSGATAGRDKNAFLWYIGGPAIDDTYPNIRGYGYREFSGSVMHLINLEYRSRFIEHARFMLPFPFILKNIDGTVFFDAGSAYRDPAKYRFMYIENGRKTFDDFKASWGFGLRFVFLYLPWKLDFSMPLQGIGYGMLPLSRWTTELTISLDF